MILNLLTLVFAVRASYSNVYSPGMMNGGMQQPMTAATSMQQAGMNGMMASFTLAKANAYCKNHRMSSQGELLQGETIVLSNPMQTVQSCYTAVMRATSIGCGNTFVANNAGECACLRPQVQCRYEDSKTGLGVYTLSSFLSKTHEDKEETAKVDEDSEPVLKNHKNVPVAAAMPMGGAAYNPMYPNAMQTGILGRPSYQQMNVNRGCDNEVEDSTDGLPPVRQLGASTNADQCAIAVQTQQRMGMCGDMFMFTPTTMGCSCIRAGQFCDDESMPGTTLFKSNTATTPMTGAGMVAGMTGMPGTTAGMVPGMTGMTGTTGMMPGMVPGATTGMMSGMTGTGMMTGMTGTTGMMPMTGMGMTGQTTGMTGMATGYQRPMTGMTGMTGMTPGMTTGAMTPGMTGYGRTPGMMTPGVAAYPHVLSKMRTEEILCTKVLDKPSCEQHGCMWAGDACAEFTMQEEGEALSEKVLFYVVVPITLVCVTLALICGARRCAQSTKAHSDRPEALLLDDRKDHIVPVV